MTANKGTPQTGENVSEEQFDNDYGARVANIGTVEGDTAIDVVSDFEESKINVKGQWLDDEPGLVELRVSMLSGEMAVSLDPEEADAFAAKLRSAASFAEKQTRPQVEDDGGD